MLGAVKIYPRRNLGRALLALALVLPFARAVPQARGDRLPSIPPPGPADQLASSTRAAPADWLVQTAADWMARLPNSTSLGNLSIPGTHDSGARFGVVWCRNQSWKIEGMLAAGIRYLDIRNYRLAVISRFFTVLADSI